MKRKGNKEELVVFGQSLKNFCKAMGFFIGVVLTKCLVWLSRFQFRLFESFIVGIICSIFITLKIDVVSLLVFHLTFLLMKYMLIGIKEKQESDIMKFLSFFKVLIETLFLYVGFTLNMSIEDINLNINKFITLATVSTILWLFGKFILFAFNLYIKRTIINGSELPLMYRKTINYQEFDDFIKTLSKEIIHNRYQDCVQVEYFNEKFYTAKGFYAVAYRDLENENRVVFRRKRDQASLGLYFYPMGIDSQYKCFCLRIKLIQLDFYGEKYSKLVPSTLPLK